MGKHSKLTLPERRLISVWLEEGLKVREISRRLKRNHTTVSREVRRNRFKGRYYVAITAQAKADTRKKKAWESKQPLKNSDLYSYVIDKLRTGWSPETITGRLREIDHPGDPHWHICHETVYAFVYGDMAKKLFPDTPLFEYLRRKQKRRRKQGGRKAQRIRIPDRVSIHDRPQEITLRQIFGHWEGDTVVGKGRGHGLHTAYERLASFIRLEYMPDLTAESSYLAQKQIYQPLPKQARRSTTLDNGHEHVLHKKLQEEVGIPAYFADPYSSWQRGGNENANLWVRYYFPKGTDFTKITPEELRDVEYDLNSRPRKRLGYLTPLEVFTYHLNRCNRN